MLIKNVKEDIIKEISVSIEFSFEAVKPYLENEGSDFVKEVLGSTLYKALVKAYDDAGTLDNLEEKYKVLLPLVQRPLVNFAYLKYLPFGDVHVSDGGITVKRSETSAPASTRRVQNLMDALAETAWNAREKLVKFLYANADEYGWYGSRPQKAYIVGLINFSSQVNDLANVKISAETFSRMKSSVRFIELNAIRPMILGKLFDKIKEQVSRNLFEDEEVYPWETGSGSGSGSGNGSGEGENVVNHKILLELVRPAVANLSLAHALQSHRIDISATGITEGYDTERGGDNVKASAVVRNEVLRQAINRFREDGEMYLSLAKDYLIDHLDDFPLYKNDSERNTDETKEDRIFENKAENKGWGGF